MFWVTQCLMGRAHVCAVTLQMPEFLRKFDWDKHILGPMDKWPTSLKTTISIVMACPYPVSPSSDSSRVRFSSRSTQWAVWWGPELALVYNEAYAEMSGKKHPSFFGKAGKVGGL